MTIENPKPTPNPFTTLLTKIEQQPTEEITGTPRDFVAALTYLHATKNPAAGIKKLRDTYVAMVLRVYKEKQSPEQALTIANKNLDLMAIIADLMKEKGEVTDVELFLECNRVRNGVKNLGPITQLCRSALDYHPQRPRLN